MTGVILAAGYGTRFLPASKSVPKELFPVLNESAIDFILKEFIEAGIQRLFIVTNRRKGAVEAYLDRDVELEQQLAGNEKLSQLPGFAQIPTAYIRQEAMRGTGHALLSLKPFVGDSPFIVAYPDDLILEANATQQLINAHQQTGRNVLACVQVPEDQAHLYGMVQVGDSLHSGVYSAQELVEKPAPGKSPSNWASIGRYLYTPDFLQALEKSYEGYSGTGEFYHVEALKMCGDQNQLSALALSGKRFDIGSMAGYLNFIGYQARKKGLAEHLTADLP